MIKCELAALVLFVFFAVMPCIGRDDTRVDNILSRTNLPERRFLMACARSDLSADEYSKLLVDLAEGTLSKTNEFETIWHKEVLSSMNMFATTNALPYIERIMASDNEDEQAALMVAYTRLRHFDSCARSVVVRLARRNMQARKIAGKIVERAFLKLSQVQEDEKSRILKADVELLASELGMRALKNPGLKSVEPKADRRIIHATGTTGCRSINVAPDARKEDR